LVIHSEPTGNRLAMHSFDYILPKAFLHMVCINCLLQFFVASTSPKTIIFIFLSHNWFCFSFDFFFSLSFSLRGLQEDFDKETVLRKLFWKARAKARKDLKEQLSEFRDKRVAGLGSIYGPPGICGSQPWCREFLFLCRQIITNLNFNIWHLFKVWIFKMCRHLKNV